MALDQLVILILRLMKVPIVRCPDAEEDGCVREDDDDGDAEENMLENPER